ncbi:MAG: hypothetical protein HOV83_29020 [Catenulispora sp.]|nr:hypothetical protein [Catenulispora sp.]
MVPGGIDGQGRRVGGIDVADERARRRRVERDAQTGGQVGGVEPGAGDAGCRERGLERARFRVQDGHGSGQSPAVLAYLLGDRVQVQREAEQRLVPGRGRSRMPQQVPIDRSRRARRIQAPPARPVAQPVARVRDRALENLRPGDPGALAQPGDHPAVGRYAPVLLVGVLEQMRGPLDPRDRDQPSALWIVDRPDRRPGVQDPQRPGFTGQLQRAVPPRRQQVRPVRLVLAPAPDHMCRPQNDPPVRRKTLEATEGSDSADDRRGQAGQTQHRRPTGKQ